MKKILTFIALVLLSASAFAQTSKDLYTKYSDKAGVAAVYVSPTMFKLMKAIPDFKISGDSELNIGGIIRSLNGLYILSVENESTAKALAAEVDKLVKSGKYELLMETKENGETTRIYTIEKDGVVSDMVLLNKEAAETSFIAFSGSIPADELAKMLDN